MKNKETVFPTFIFYLCIAMYAVVMVDIGYPITTLQFWIGFIGIVIARICGEEISEKKMKND